MKTNSIALVLAPPPCHSGLPLLQTETEAPSAHSAPLSSHPPGAHLCEGRKVTSTGHRSEQYWSPISTSTGRNADHYWSRREPVLVTRPLLIRIRSPTPSPLPYVIVLATLTGESSPYKLDPSPNEKKRGITVSREPSLLNIQAE